MGQSSAAAATAKPDRRKQPGPQASAHKAPARPADGSDGTNDLEAHTYHDLPDKEAEYRLDAADHGLVRGSSAETEPSSALEHYERAVEKENSGSLGDSLLHYRKAFRVGYTTFGSHVVQAELSFLTAR